MNTIKQILQLRDAGLVTCAIADIPSNVSGVDAADGVVKAQGFDGLEAEWLEISAADALAIATTLLHRDLAYRSDIMPLAIASELATQLFDPVPEPHVYFTNGEWTIDDDESGLATLHSWTPISKSSFDSGIVCLGDGRAGVLWVQDED